MEHNAPNKPTLKEKLLAKIRNEEVRMHPRAYFAAKVVALGAVAIAILFVTISIVNLISFGLRLNGHDSLLAHGSRGWLVFLSVFPWFLLAIDIILVVLLEWMLRQFRFANRIPVLYLLGGIFFATIVIGFIIDRETPFNDHFLREADQQHLPQPFSDYFEGARRAPPHGSACRCTITAINGNTILADDIDVGTTTHLTILVPANYPDATTSLSVGDIVFIAGDRQGNTIEAFSISKSPRARPPEHRE